MGYLIYGRSHVRQQVYGGFLYANFMEGAGKSAIKAIWVCEGVNSPSEH